MAIGDLAPGRAAADPVSLIFNRWVGNCSHLLWWKLNIKLVADAERDPLVLLMDDIGLMFSWRWMSANIPQYSWCGGFIRSVSASFYSLSFPLTCPLITIWNLKNGIWHFWPTRHLPSLASTNMFLFIKKCFSSQSSIIHLTCVGPCLGSQLWSPPASPGCLWGSSQSFVVC